MLASGRYWPQGGLGLWFVLAVPESSAARDGYMVRYPGASHHFGADHAGFVRILMDTGLDIVR